MSHGISCFFIGHREADERLLPRLELEIERFIAEENVRSFYVGGYGGFDRIAAIVYPSKCSLTMHCLVCWK